jgi:hypothetical protein
VVDQDILALADSGKVDKITDTKCSKHGSEGSVFSCADWSVERDVVDPENDLQEIVGTAMTR